MSSGPNDLNLRFTLEDDASKPAAEANEAIRGEVKKTADVVSRASAQEGDASDAVADAANRVNAAFDKAAASISTGSTRAGRSLLQAQIAVDDLRQAIEQAQAQGSPVTPAQIAQLKQAEARFGALRNRLSEVQAKQKDLKDDLDAGQVALKAEVGQINSLQDVLRLGGARWADFGAQLGAVIGTFEVAYAQGEKLRSVLNAIGEELGHGPRSFDAWISSTLRLDAVAEKLVKTLDREAETAQDLANKVKILDANGIAHAGTIADINEKYEALSRTLQGTVPLIEASNAAFAAFVTKISGGLTIDSLKKTVDDALAAIEGFGGNVDALASSPIFPALREQLLATEKQLDVFGPAFRRSLAPEDVEKFDAEVSIFREQILAGLGKDLADLGEKEAITEAKTKSLADALLKTLPEGAKSAQEAIAALAAQGDRDFAALEARLHGAQASAAASGQAGAASPSGGGADRQVAATSAEVAQLQARVDELNGTPLLTVDQINELEAAQRQLAELEDAAQSTESTVTVLGPTVQATSDAFQGLSINTTHAVDALGRLPGESTSEAMVRIALAAQRASAGMAGSAVEARRNADGLIEISTAADQSAVQLQRNADGFQEISNSASASALEVKKNADGLLSISDAATRAKEGLDGLSAKTGKAAEGIGKISQAGEEAARVLQGGWREVNGELTSTQALLDTIFLKFQKLNTLKLGGEPLSDMSGF